MRKGFSLVTAIIILVVISTLMASMISLSSTSAKSTVDIYLKEQADLLLKSATEYALLAISGHNNSLNCIEKINILYPNGTTPTHEISVSMLYIGNGIVNCSTIVANDVVTADSNLTIIVDTTVSVNQALTGITEPIRVHRRSIQKP